MDPVVSSSSSSSSSSTSTNSASSSTATQQQQQQQRLQAASKFQTDCSVEHRESLECIGQNYETKDYTCAPFFHRYKACRKEENERRQRANAASNASKSSWWFG
jgi:hypothetical protein